MSPEEALSFVMRQSLASCEGYSTGLAEGTISRADILVGAIFTIGQELEAMLRIVQQIETVDAITKTPAEAKALLTAGFGVLTYLSVLACSTVMMMPNLERVDAPKEAITH